MAGVVFKIPQERQDVKLHNYLVEHATSVGDLIPYLDAYFDKSRIVKYFNTYELNQTGIVVVEDQFARVSEGRIIGSDEGVKGLINLLNVQEFIKK